MEKAKHYAWVDDLPRMLVQARTLLGTIEFDGSTTNSASMASSEDVDIGTNEVLTADSAAWCGLFMAVVAERAGKPPRVKPCGALNWGAFGEDGGQPELAMCFRSAARRRRAWPATSNIQKPRSAKPYHMIGEGAADDDDA